MKVKSLLRKKTKNLSKQTKVQRVWLRQNPKITGKSKKRSGSIQTGKEQSTGKLRCMAQRQSDREQM